MKSRKVIQQKGAYTSAVLNRCTRVGVCLVVLGFLEISVRSEQEPAKLAGELTLHDAIGLAEKRNPALRSSEWQIRAREAEAKQAGVVPNPKIEAEAENFGGSGELSGTDAAEYTVLLSQPFLLGGKRSKEVRVADVERRLAEWTYESVKRDLVKDVTATFAEVLESQEHVDLAKELVQLSEELVETAKRRVKAGGASVLEETKAEIERATSLADQEQRQQGLTASRRRLATLLGLPIAELPPVSGNLYQLHDIPTFDDLKQRLADSPDWARWSAELEQREAAVALADAERIPDLHVGIGWRRDEGADADAFVFAAGLPLPLFNRNQGARQAAMHERAAAAEERAAVELALERELAEAYSELTRAHAQAKAIKETILPAANKSFEVSREGYLQGRFGYLDLLDAQRTLFETKGQYVETLRAYHQAVAEVERLTSSKPNIKN